MHQDANRCLKCKNALCQKNCPIHTDIPKIIDLYINNEIKKAQELLFKHNPLSAICSLVCDHQRQCFGHCVLNHKNVPIHFYEIEQELSLAYLNDVHFDKNEITKAKVAIIGQGPCGIASAILLSDDGYDVTMFDENSDLGGVLRYGIPDFRLDKKIVDHYKRILLEKGVKLRNNVRIGTTISLSKLKDNFDIILIATGTSMAKMANIKNETVYNMHYAVDFLKDPSSFDLGHKVIVIGGGNVAMDASRCAKRLGYDTYVYYRKTFEDMPANKDEIEEAIAEGVKFEVFEVPIAMDDKGMIFAKGKNEIDENGKKYTVTIADTEHHVDCDSVIAAISQTLRVDFKELSLNKWGFYETDDKHMTSMDNVFVAGDAYLGAKTVVSASNDAYEVVKCIKEKLGDISE